jgi:hypothetical protein
MFAARSVERSIGKDPRGDEEGTGGLDPPPDYDAEEDLRDGVDENEDEVDVQRGGPDSRSRTAGNPAALSALRTALKIASAVASAARAPRTARFASPSQLPRARAKSVSPSAGVCAG